jgi:hypothetical protein
MATVIAYRRHFLMLIVAVVALQFIGKALDQLLAGEFRVFALLGVAGALHAGAIVLSLKRRPNIVRSACFVALAACFNYGAFFSGFTSFALFPFVPAIARLLPNFLDKGDSSAGDSVKVLLFVAAGSAFGALAYWLIVRAFWVKGLRRRDLLRTLAFCVTASLLVFIVWGALGSTAVDFNSIRDLLPTVMWWFAFSASLWLSERRDNEEIVAASPSLNSN